MYVRDFSDLPSAWQEGGTRGDFWPVIALVGCCLLVAVLAAIFVPQFATLTADAVAP